MKTTLNANDMVQDAVSEIEKFAPKNSHVAVEVSEDPIGVFSTRIRVDTKQRTYFAKKNDMFLYRSFSKAIRALKAQLSKKRASHPTVRASKFNEA